MKPFLFVVCAFFLHSASAAQTETLDAYLPNLDASSSALTLPAVRVDGTGQIYRATLTLDFEHATFSVDALQQLTPENQACRFSPRRAICDFLEHQ